jgi:predicted dehydrogenase
VIGAGSFATRVLIPGLIASGLRARAIASASGTSASVAGRRFGFERITTDPDELFGDDEVDVIVVATRHDTHARLAVRALEAKKHVFVEKPLALTHTELDLVASAMASSDRLLTVGFNRRFSPHARALQSQLSASAGPVALILTVNAGAIPAEHWTQDASVGGGRIVGEACHFIDLARFLAGASIAGIDVTSVRRDGVAHDDVAHLSIRFTNGSTGVVHYLANGSAAFPKERIEAFCGGRIWSIDNWRRLRGFGARGGRGGGPFASVDKGHREEIQAFAASVRSGGPPPIAYDELIDVSNWAIRAAEMARASPSIE